MDKNPQCYVHASLMPFLFRKITNFSQFDIFGHETFDRCQARIFLRLPSEHNQWHCAILIVHLVTYYTRCLEGLDIRLGLTRVPVSRKDDKTQAVWNIRRRLNCFSLQDKWPRPTTSINWRDTAERWKVEITLHWWDFGATFPSHAITKYDDVMKICRVCMMRMKRNLEGWKVKISVSHFSHPLAWPP